MTDRYPAYDVLSKREGMSFNALTRRVLDERVALPERGDVLTEGQRRTLRALADRIVPQPEGRPSVNTVALVLDKLAKDARDGYRHHRLPPLLEAWSRGLDALEAEARARFSLAFAELTGADADTLLSAVERGDAHEPAWGDMPPPVWWSWRMLPDLVSAYYAHPSAWSAMGFGGPASPRGYVRLDLDRRDPWEAAEAGDGRPRSAEARNRRVR